MSGILTIIWAAGRAARALVGYGHARRAVNIAGVAALVTFSTLTGVHAANSPVRILVLGDSLASGWGLEAGQAFPARLEAALRRAGYDVRVLNAGVAGDTTAGGLARLEWSLAEKPDAVIVELGGNDGLRGIDPENTFANLDAIITRLKSRGIAVLLTGMKAPPNLGRDYGAAFNAVFPRLAERHDVAFYPFILDGVAGRPELNQGDGIHPNARGVAIMVDRIMPHVVRLLANLE